MVVGIHTGAVLGYAPRKIVGDPDVQFAGLAGEDVDVVVTHR
jgi:hypothetical protein